MGFKVPAYPELLTNTVWQKKKGLLAKAAGETGMGDLMKTLQGLYGKVAWEKFNLAIAAKGQGAKRTKEDVKEAYDDAVTESKKLNGVDSAARDIERKATKLVVDWKKVKTIPAASVKVVEEVGAAAKTFSYSVALGTILDALKKEKDECDESIDKIADEYKKLNNKFRFYVNGFEAACKDKKLSDYGAVWKENIRGVGTVLPVLAKDHPEFAKEWDIWKKFSNVLKTPESEEAMQKQFEILTKVAASLKPKAAKLP